MNKTSLQPDEVGYLLFLLTKRTHQCIEKLENEFNDKTYWEKEKREAEEMHKRLSVTYKVTLTSF